MAAFPGEVVMSVQGATGKWCSGLAIGFAVLSSGALGACGGSRALPASTTMSHEPHRTTTTSLRPTLGLTGAWFEGAGFGQVEPSEVYLGGDPTGQVTGIGWQSWGASEATGLGLSWYVAPNQGTADGGQRTAAIVAFDLGTCAGHPAYQEVEWYFPAVGGSFDPSRAVYACQKGYVNPNE